MYSQYGAPGGTWMTQHHANDQLYNWGRACYLSVTDVPHNIDSLRVNAEETPAVEGLNTAPGPRPLQTHLQGA